MVETLCWRVLCQWSQRAKVGSEELFSWGRFEARMVIVKATNARSVPVREMLPPPVCHQVVVSMKLDASAMSAWVASLRSVSASCLVSWLGLVQSRA